MTTVTTMAIDLSDESSSAGVVVRGAGDDAALDAPSPFPPTHQLDLNNMCQLSLLKVLTCGSGGGAGGPGNGVSGGVVVKCGEAPCRGCGGPCGSCWGPCGYLSGVVSW